MKSMEKLDVLREAGAEPRLAEAIVRTQEASDYITKDYLDARLDGMEQRLLHTLTTRLWQVGGLVILGVGIVVGLLDRFVRPG